MKDNHLYYYEYQTPLGIMTLACLMNRLAICAFGSIDVEGIHQSTPYLEKAYQQLMEYFEGQRQVFDLQYTFIKGTPFQQKVWNELLHIPYGQCVTYQDIAQRIGSPRAYRAVGNANHHNPIVIFIPCHRVIGTSHKLVGYGGGIDKKIYLLELENNDDWKQ